MRVLVIEDDSAVRETLGMVLEAYDHQPILVRSGAEAIEFLSRDWPDVMLLDLTLEESSGEEVYAGIRRRFGRVPPTVVLSAVTDGELRARHMSGVCFLAKPYTLEELCAILEAAASGGCSRAESA